MHNYLLVQSPGGGKTFINLACVSDAMYGIGESAPREIREKVGDGSTWFIVYMRQILGETRYQNYFWWQGVDADIVQEEFQKAVRNPQPLYTVVLPAED